MIINVETIKGTIPENVYRIDQLSYLGKLLSCKESKKRDITYLEIPCAFDIETTTITEDIDQYKTTDSDIYERLKGIRIYYNDHIKKDIPDFESIRKRVFNQIRLSKGRPNIDSVYQELSDEYPYYFPSYILNPSDQLLKIINIYEQNKPAQDDFRPYAFMYHWQFCLDDEVVFGRTWAEFSTLLSTLSTRMNLDDKHRLVIWVHNLPYEFQFFRKFVNVTEAFCKDDHKPIRVAISGGIEFRDSYALSNMSLEKFCKNERGVIHYKMSGDDYDYSKIRTALTPLSNAEMAYCYNDVRGLCECIRSRLQDDTLASIPMTSTGYVRRLYRSAMRQNPDNRFIFENGRLTPHLYEMLRKAFRGGDCHANIRYADQTLKNISSWDISSSYPAVLMTEKYPMGKWTKVSRKYFIKHQDEFKDHALLMTIRYENIRYTAPYVNPYISESKCDHVPINAENKNINIVTDNGRIGFASWIEMTVTNIDWQIIEDEYTYDRRLIKEIYVCLTGYMPEEFRNVLRDLFIKKTELKNDPDHVYEYNRSKERINASYGMTVQRIDQMNWTYENGTYKAEEPDLEEQLIKYFKSKNSFLRYDWGVWCTAYARQRLRMGLRIAGRRFVYCDTDSVKCDGEFKKEFAKLNAALQEKAEAAKAFAYDRAGNIHYMGVYEYECTYEKFRTLGAKKYAYQIGDEVTTTIAGVNKKRGQRFFTENGIDALKDGTVIPDSGHLVAYYNDDDPHVITVDHCEMLTASNIALCDDTYTIGMTSDYLDLLKKALENITDLYYTE